jgi:hypothetical protein
MSGATAALPMWRKIAEDGLANGWLQKDETFAVPPGVIVKDIEYYSGLLSGGGGRTLKEAFVAGTEPNRQVTSQWSTITTLPWYQQKAFYIPKEGEKMPGQPGAQTAAPGSGQPGPQEAPAEGETEGEAPGPPPP